jgi:hypothetical protein
MAIVTAQSKIQAECSAFGRVKESTFNPGQQIQSIKFVSLDGTKEHWATFPVEQAKAFNMGQPCNLIPTQRRGKDTFDIEPLDLPAAPQMPAPQPQRPLGFRAAPEQSYAAPVPYQQPAQVPVQQPAGQSPEQKRAIASFITGQADLLGFCRKEAARVLPDNDPPEVLQAAAATLFISASRKFRLEA